LLMSASSGRLLCRKRKATEVRTPQSRVRFSHVTIRTHSMELWGGGGVPADEGPPLGLSWEVMGERHVCLDEYEGEREQERTPKDSYCSVGCVEPSKRAEILRRCGSTAKQMRTVKQAVARLNKQRWQATSMLFNDAWLFSVPASTDPGDVLPMIGHHEAESFVLDSADWTSLAAFAKAFESLVAPSELFAPDLDLDSLATFDWARLCDALQVCANRQMVLIIDCAAVQPDAPQADLPRHLLGRLIGTAAQALVSLQVLAEPPRGSLLVVLQGWSEPHVFAESDDGGAEQYFTTQVQ